jgi:hypothetical protein
MRTKLDLMFIVAFMLWAVMGVQSQPSAKRSGASQASLVQKWSLPQGSTVKDNGPRTYRFTVDYNNANARGEVMSRQRFTGDYTRGLEGGDVLWKNVTQADAAGPNASFGPPQKQDYMEGFRYRNDMSNTMKPDFFKGFPPAAVFERNLVWDTGMIEMFGQNYFAHLKLNEPYHAISDQDVNMPDVGTFRNHDVVLEWIGNSQRNGQDCALITYKAFFNPVEIATGGMTLKGRSDYWGEIWVSLGTKQIEYATLHEVVVGEMKLPSQESPMTIDVFRIGTFEPLDGK